MTKIKNLGLIGVGLIGTSVLLGLTKKNLVSRVYAYDTNSENIDYAIKEGWVDENSTIDEIAKKCDFVIIATPTKAIINVLKQLAYNLNPNATVIDVGSTKAEIITYTHQNFPHLKSCFVPCHPIAGWHTNGPHSANPNLFVNRNIVITPFNETPSERLEFVKNLWDLLGAKVNLMTSFEQHDKIFSALSHLPHFIASSYMEYLMKNVHFRDNIDLGGTGFRDFSRIAGGSAQVWTDIFLSNRDVLLEQINDFETHLIMMRELIDSGDKVKIMDWLERTSELRNSWKGIIE